MHPFDNGIIEKSTFTFAWILPKQITSGGVILEHDARGIEIIQWMFKGMSVKLAVKWQKIPRPPSFQG